MAVVLVAVRGLVLPMSLATHWHWVGFQTWLRRHSLTKLHWQVQLSSFQAKGIQQAIFRGQMHFWSIWLQTLVSPQGSGFGRRQEHVWLSNTDGAGQRVIGQSHFLLTAL